MALHEIHHYGFHGHAVLRFRGEIKGGEMDRSVEVSPRVAKRLNDAVCGMSDCRCAEYVAYSETEQRAHGDVTRWYVSI